MARRCKVCQHPELDEINALLIEGVESRQPLCVRFGVSTASMHRHFHGHMPKVSTEGASADSTTASTADHQQRAAEARLIREQAMEAGDPRLALQALKMEAALDAEARKLGAVRHATTGDLVSSPEWVRLRTAIMTKLEPYPDARAAVVAACMEVGAAE
jgi:hypothetical protein